MIYIAHRINTVEELKYVPDTFGVEIDVRDVGGDLILAHDAFADGEKFSNFLKYYRHKLLVVNVKSFGIESQIIQELKNFNITEFFFLDSAMSVIVQLSKGYQTHFSGRVSEFESIETVRLSKNLYDWVWIDCFTEYSLSTEVYLNLHKILNKKLCLTSPDLLNREFEIESHAKKILSTNCYPEAICTKLKNIETWQNFLGK